VHGDVEHAWTVPEAPVLVVIATVPAVGSRRRTVRRGTTRDLGSLLPLVREFCAADGHDFDEEVVLAGLAPLLEDGAAGEVWVVEDDSGLGGYGVVTWGWSLESGGRDALLDELYVRERGRGAGAALLDAILVAARAGGASRMFLETEEGNTGARRFYARAGFDVEESVWMQRPL
jgi:GNAT superfamily N-acetyltransferase